MNRTFDGLNKKLIFESETTVFHMLDAISEVMEHDGLLLIVKYLDELVSDVDFTKMIYNWARDELIKEGVLEDTAIGSIDSFVELVNATFGREIVKKVEEE